MIEQENGSEENNDSKLSKILFKGKWVEKEGVKWAFFSSEKDRASRKSEKTSKKEKKEKIVIPEDLKPIDVKNSERVSITALGRSYGGARYSQEESSTIPDEGRLEPDTILSGRYRILEFYKSLQKRDFYLAKDTRLETPCIVKELACDITDVEEKIYYNLRFKEEARILADLSHPNLPTVMDFFIENGRSFMVVDYIKGFDLETLLENEDVEFSQEQILLWGIDICEVLTYLHTYDPPIIHRGISPASLFLRDSDWAVILFNFSFVRKLDKTSTYKVGPAGFAPPEQLVGKAQIKSDLYSLGATLYFLLTGAMANEKFKFIPPSSIDSSLSIYTDMALKNALKLNVKERFNTAEEMKEALLDAYDKLLSKEEEIVSEEDPFSRLSEMLHQKEFRFRAIKRLGKLGDKRAVDLLVPFLNDQSAAVRLAVISAFENLKEKRVVSHLTRLFDDENFEIRKKAIKAIEKITGKKLPPLMVVPKNDDLYTS